MIPGGKSIQAGLKLHRAGQAARDLGKADKTLSKANKARDRAFDRHYRDGMEHRYTFGPYEKAQNSFRNVVQRQSDVVSANSAVRLARNRYLASWPALQSANERAFMWTVTDVAFTLENNRRSQQTTPATGGGGSPPVWSPSPKPKPSPSRSSSRPSGGGGHEFHRLNLPQLLGATARPVVPP